MNAKSKKVKLNHEAYSSGSSLTKLTTERLAKNITICEEWTLSIDLKLPSRSITEWRNIFGLYVSTNTEQLQPLLAVSIRPDQSNVTLKITYNVDTYQTYTYNVTKKLNAGNWINLKISQNAGIYKINVDYELVHNKTNFVPKIQKNVYLVTGNTSGKEGISIIVYYRNFKINTCKARGKNTNNATRSNIQGVELIQTMEIFEKSSELANWSVLPQPFELASSRLAQHP